MNWKKEARIFFWLSGGFATAYLMPLKSEHFQQALQSALELMQWYAREHVLLCLIPAFFIAGVISVFVSQAAVIKYFGAGTKKWLSYLVASLSGSVLAVCSCTILPLFSGIHKRGAGLGPAIAFLYSGPAINILAIILTARVLGLELGLARVLGAVSFSILIGLCMHFIFRKEEKEKVRTQLALPPVEERRPIWQTAVHFFILVLILVVINWSGSDKLTGIWRAIYHFKWTLTSGLGLLLSISLVTILKINARWVTGAALLVILINMLAPGHPLIPFMGAIFLLSALLIFHPGEPQDWFRESWGFAKQILPLLAAGIAVAGFLLGFKNPGIVPQSWIVGLVGGNSVFSNFFASVVGAFMYFATLTEIPILKGLLQAGMGPGPALSLLLAGPALSLPNMLVIRGVMGTRKTLVYVSLVVVMATIGGLIFGALG